MTTGADVLTDVLFGDGVDVCFANPGTSKMHFVAAPRPQAQRIALRPRPFRGCCHRRRRRLCAHGRQPAATLLHPGPGLANGLANLHNARAPVAPMVNIVGTMLPTTLRWMRRLPSTSKAWHGRCPLHGAAASKIRYRRAPAAEAALRAIRPQCRFRVSTTLILPADAAWGRSLGLRLSVR